MAGCGIAQVQAKRVNSLGVATVRDPVKPTGQPQGGLSAEIPGNSTETPASTLVQPLTQPTNQPLVQPLNKQVIQPTVRALVSGPLFDTTLDLRSGPVEVPLELQIPVLKVNAGVLGVGITSENVMHTPMGPADDPIWQKVFWYRGSGIPGVAGTATISGHVTDLIGRPGVFARLTYMRPGDLVMILDKRNGLEMRFIVDKLKTFTVEDPPNQVDLAEIYGHGPVSGKAPQPAADGQSHLTLITCTGNYVDGSFDRRLVVYATRSVSLPLKPLD